MSSIKSAHETLSSRCRGLLARLRAHVRQLACGVLHGHDVLMHFEERRVSLRCMCGYETPGWEITPLDRSQQPAVSKPRIFRMPPIGQRRVA